MFHVLSLTIKLTLISALTSLALLQLLPHFIVEEVLDGAIYLGFSFFRAYFLGPCLSFQDTFWGGFWSTFMYGSVLPAVSSIVTVRTEQVYLMTKVLSLFFH